MSTTTLRLPPDLRDRISKLAEQSGTTAHSFMLEAIAERVANEELRREFLEEGDNRIANMLEMGVGIEWADMRGYLRERAANRAAELPKVKKWRD
ncbi:CopG family transcriptional regulator [Paraburkholderia piptadeniae]|uniref:CopG family transcriptional regulator n=1 Tax=Paraburkholderia piptadeniae TaxID=1701573 RepID=A0A1N7SW37_9BURK|nr:CopG family transcriptional regulator [Paraburkholderia piptadeniae]SIT51688.1 CopG family transcriptional regulator [Paraburkholderia piptadeniae]